MRFARFVFALFVGAFLFIALMKLLFFGLMAAVIIGGASWIMRAMAYHHRYGSHYNYNYRYEYRSPFEGHMNAGPTPLDPRWHTGQKASNAYGRRIEVL